MLKGKVKVAVELYNRYHSPEAHAELVKLDSGTLTVRFSGSSCRTRGINDWVEDFKYMLESLGVDAELEKVIEPSDLQEEFRLGIFKIKHISIR
ncbi:MAG: hypothetical protein B6U73_01430 [Desulfurococcales archaeon ex4484_204]|nr:MAG: hypothetical protein B6U73_01430 [Desulfurococcales archaeon ex4484_204]